MGWPGLAGVAAAGGARSGPAWEDSTDGCKAFSAVQGHIVRVPNLLAASGDMLCMRHRGFTAAWRCCHARAWPPWRRRPARSINAWEDLTDGCKAVSVVQEHIVRVLDLSSAEV